MSRILGSCVSLFLGLGVLGPVSSPAVDIQEPAFSWLWEGDYALFGFGFLSADCVEPYMDVEVVITALEVMSATDTLEPISVSVTEPTDWYFLSSSIGLSGQEEPWQSSGYLTPALGRLFFESVPLDYETGTSEYFHGYLASNYGSFLWADAEFFDSTEVATIDEQTECLPKSFQTIRFGIPIVPIPAPGQIAGDWQGISLGARLTPESEIYNASLSRFEATFNAEDFSGLRAVTQAAGHAAVASEVFTWTLSEDSTAIEIAEGFGPTFHVSPSYGLMVGLQVYQVEPSPLTLEREGEFDYGFDYYIAVRQGDDIPHSGLVGSYGWTILSAQESEISGVDFHFTDVERGILNLYGNGRFRLFSNPTASAYSRGESPDSAAVEGGVWEQVEDKVVLSFRGENEGEQFALMAGDGGNVLIGLQEFPEHDGFVESDVLIAIQLDEKELHGAWTYFPEIEPETPDGYEVHDWEDNGYGIDSPVFGEFSSLSDFPWIFHVNHGGLYCHGEGGVSYWFYDYMMGTWLYTTLELYADYNLLYSTAHSSWVLYRKETGTYGEGRWFYIWNEDVWILTGHSTSFE